MIKNPFHYCNKCNKYIKDLNECEKEELNKEVAFVCSDCINKEMNEETKPLTEEEKNQAEEELREQNQNYFKDVCGGIK